MGKEETRLLIEFNKQYNKAITAADIALTKSPDHRGAMMCKALVYISQKDYEKLHNFFWLFTLDLNSSKKITQSIILNWIN